MKEVSGSELAALTGKTWRTVKERLEKAGVQPKRREGPADLYDSVLALAAIYVGDASDFDNQRERLAAAQAEKVEMENAVRRGQLTEIEAVERAWGGFVMNARARLLGMGTKLGPQLVNIGDAAVIAAAIRTESRAALAELADYVPDGSPGESDEAVPPPAGTDGKPVGRRRKKAK
jgi:hypothetical protein